MERNGDVSEAGAFQPQGTVEPRGERYLGCLEDSKEAGGLGWARFEQWVCMRSAREPGLGPRRFLQPGQESIVGSILGETGGAVWTVDRGSCEAIGAIEVVEAGTVVVGTRVLVARVRRWLDSGSLWKVQLTLLVRWMWGRTEAGVKDHSRFRALSGDVCVTCV